MNKVVKLVNEWDAFEQTHPAGDVADFCRFYLAQTAMANKSKMVGGHIPPKEEALLMKIMGHIMSAYSIYHQAAMDAAGAPFREAFYFLNVLRHSGEMKKTELVNSLLMEYTTGMDGINKMIKAGYINERAHDTDKRARLINLSPKGEMLLQKCYTQMGKLTDMMCKGMHPEAIKLCISLLSEMEMRQSEVVHKAKGLSFDEMHKIVME